MRLVKSTPSLESQCAGRIPKDTVHSATASEAVAEAGANKDSHVFRKDGGGQKYGCFQNSGTPEWMVYNGKPY